LLEDVGRETRDSIDLEAARLEEWLGTTRVSGSFPTPLEIELRLPRDPVRSSRPAVDPTSGSPPWRVEV